MRKMTLLAAAVLGASSLAHAESAAPAAPAHPGYAPFQAMQAQHLAAMQAAMAHHAALAPGYGDSALAERATSGLRELNERIAADMAAMHERMLQARTPQAPDFDAAPMDPADVDALFAERRQEMEAHFASVGEDLEAPAAPEVPEYLSDGRFEQMEGRFEARKARFEAAREDAEARMSEAREALKARVQERRQAHSI